MGSVGHAKNQLRQGIAIHTFNASTQRQRWVDLWVRSQHDLHSECQDCVERSCLKNNSNIKEPTWGLHCERKIQCTSFLSFFLPSFFPFFSQSSLCWTQIRDVSGSTSPVLVSFIQNQDQVKVTRRELFPCRSRHRSFQRDLAGSSMTGNVLNHWLCEAAVLYTSMFSSKLIKCGQNLSANQGSC